jgi:hypothetical protein
LNNQHLDPATLKAAAALTLNPLAKYCPLTPFQKQNEFLALTDREVLYGGAVGGSKSVCLLMGALQFVHIPGYSAIIFRKTYTDLALPNALIAVSHEWLDNTDAHWDSQQKVWTFPSGAKLAFGYLDAPQDRFRYQGAAFQYIAFDEVSQIDPDSYLYLQSRLRKTVELKVPLRIRAATNPGGTFGDFYHSRFIKNKAPNTYFLPASFRDNPHIDREAYELSLAVLDPITRAQLRDGQWITDGSGKVYDQFSSINIIQSLPDYPKSQWHYALGVDIGYIDATALVILGWNDNEPTLYVIKSEAYEKQTISKTAERIKQLDKQYNFEAMVIDQAGSVLTAINDIKARYNLPLQPAKKNDKLGHIRLLNSDFSSGSILILEPESRPLIKELREHFCKDSFHRKEHYSSPNHCCDALLYIHRHIKRGEFTAPIKTKQPGEEGYEDQHLAQIIAEQQADLQTLQDFDYYLP